MKTKSGTKFIGKSGGEISPADGGENPLRAIREEKRLSQRDLAQASGISRGRLRGLENGRFDEATFGELKRMAGVLDVELRDFLLATGESGLLGPDLAKRGKIAFQMDLPQAGLRIISPHPPRPDLFSGKIIVSPKKRIPIQYLPRTQAVFLQGLLGRLRIKVRQVVYEIEEGDSLVFQGDDLYILENPMLRDSIAHLVTLPSFLTPQLVSSPDDGEKSIQEASGLRFRRTWESALARNLAKERDRDGFLAFIFD